MNTNDIWANVDHTILKATSSWDEILAFCKQAIEYHAASICIPPSYVKRVSEMFGKNLVVCTVIGFPLGYNTTETKVFEAERAIKEGATEIDMVVNLGDVKNGDFNKVIQEITEVKKVVGTNLLKVIVETCYLTQEEKKQLCYCVTEAGADYIKTSTGFGTAGANIEDVALFKQNIGLHVKIKAAGGIRTREKFLEFIEAGCDRIGTSSAVQALGEKNDTDFGGQKDVH